MVVAVAAGVIALVGQISAYRARKPGETRPVSARLVLGIIVFTVIWLEFATDAYLKSAALVEIKQKLNANVKLVTVNGAQFEKFAELLLALRGVHDVPAHHSSPTTRYLITLTTSAGSLELRLCRDSPNPHEYSVFYCGPDPATSNEIGRVSTTALDGI
jgi:hypothetical protein